jgi:hypothetical protein
VFEGIELVEEMEFLLRRMTMKRLIAVLVPVSVVAWGVYAQGGPAPPDQSTTVSADNNVITGTVNVDNNVLAAPINGDNNIIAAPINGDDNVITGPIQTVSVDSGNPTAISGGGDASASAIGGSAKSDSSSRSSVGNISISGDEARTPPLTVFPPYLPYWNHGGWGTIKAYFPNGPNDDCQVYEQTFDPDNPDDMRMLRGVLKALAHDGPLEFMGGILNGVGAVFGGPDNFHHGRGFQIGNSLVRERRPRGKPLLVFIDANVDVSILREAGYAYVGKVSLEGNVDRSWDHVYDAAVAEALPWNVDILLVSGGMRGVTVGSNLSFPGAAGGYSQANYSVSLFGAASSGITEGKGKAVVSVAGYRFWPEAVNRRRIPQSFYNRIQASCQAKLEQKGVSIAVPREAPPSAPEAVHRPPSQYYRQPSVSPAEPAPLPRREAISVPKPEYRRPSAEPAGAPPAPAGKECYYGVQVSRELLQMAGFDQYRWHSNDP